MPPPFQSAILRGSGPNTRLDQAAAGGPSIKKAPPADDPEAVKRIQRGLRQLGHPMPVSFAAGEPDGKYGDETYNAVYAFQKKAFPGQASEWDGRVGKKTLEKMDAALPQGGDGPDGPPPPVLAGAGVSVGPLGGRSRIVNDYYNLCGFETIGPGQLTTSAPQPFTTFEGLVDALTLKGESHQVVVCHGNPDDGLLVPLAPGTGFSNTAQVIGDLAALADRQQEGKGDPNDSINKVLIDGVAQDARVPRSTVQRLVTKLVALRRKGLLAVHFRACNLSDGEVVRKYRRAFGARMVTHHGCRLLFLRVAPEKFKAGHRAADFKSFQNTAGKRIRVFEDPLGELPSLAIQVEDKDGHTNVESTALMDQKPTAETVLPWADLFVRKWKDRAAVRFVIPVMWVNNERTFHFPLESGWRDQLRVV